MFFCPHGALPPPGENGVFPMKELTNHLSPERWKRLEVTVDGAEGSKSDAPLPGSLALRVCILTDSLLDDSLQPFPGSHCS